MKKNKIITLVILSIFTITLTSAHPSYSFTRIVDLLFDGTPVKPEDLDTILQIIKKNKAKNKTNKNPKKAKPDKFVIVKAKQKDPRNIQLEVDTSEVLVKKEGDIQAPITNTGFLNAITDAINLWDNVEVADVGFAPLKFASGKANPGDGRNVISFRTIKDIEGIANGAPVVSIITYARNETIQFMNKLIMVKPGTILDADIIFDPTNNPCLALHTTTGETKIGGDETVISEGGVDSNANLSACESVFSGDITDLAVRTIANLLGLESSANSSSATSSVAQIMTRYALTADDEIGLANLYPKKKAISNHGIIIGTVKLNKTPIRGAHVVLEDTTTGEPIASVISDINGKFIISVIPVGTYTVYVEPVDGPIRRNGLSMNFFGLTAQLIFTTSVFLSPVKIIKNRVTKIDFEVKELSASAFNINHLTVNLNEKDADDSGGSFLLPIRIMPGETLTDVQFWGSNISSDFGTLSISGPGLTVTNVMDASIPISPFVKCEACTETPEIMCKRDPRCADTEEVTEEPDQIRGITADISCNDDIKPGPRNIIFTGNMVDPLHPSFGLRDQITGGIIVTE